MDDRTGHFVFLTERRGKETKKRPMDPIHGFWGLGAYWRPLGAILKAGAPKYLKP